LEPNVLQNFNYWLGVVIVCAELLLEHGLLHPLHVHHLLLVLHAFLEPLLHHLLVGFFGQLVVFVLLPHLLEQVFVQGFLLVGEALSDLFSLAFFLHSSLFLFLQPGSLLHPKLLELCIILHNSVIFDLVGSLIYFLEELKELAISEFSIVAGGKYVNHGIR